MKCKKKTLLLCTILSFVLLLVSCGKDDASSDEKENHMTEVPIAENIETLHMMTGEHYDNYWSDTWSKNLSSTVYPVILLDSCCEQKYQALSQSLEALNETEKTNVLSEYDSLRQQAEIDIQDNPEQFQTYQIEKHISVRRADSKVVSLLYDGASYGGGVHGMTYYHAETFDTVTGKKLALTDVVTDVSTLPELIKAELERYGKIEDLYEDLDLNEYITTNSENLTWVLDYSGLTFIFDPYEIGPYATGVQLATISFAEHPELVKTEYQTIPESYGVELSVFYPYYCDLNGDGVQDELFVQGMMSEYERYEKHIITINGNRFEGSMDGYTVEPMLIHAADGTNYLYIQDITDNDYRILTVYSLANGTAEKVDSIDAGWYSVVVDQEDYFVTEQVLTNPEEFKLDVRTDMLSTMSGHRNYHIGANGMPETDEKWYVLNQERYLTLLQPVEAQRINEETGEALDKTTLPAGTKALYYRTDNATMADLRLEDGSIVRVEIETTDWPRTVNGINIEEIFDGMIFAG